MSDLKFFLKVLQVEGYPNPNIQSIATMVGYDLDNFLMDLKEELGQEGVDSFCQKAINKLSGNDGIYIDLDSGEYIVFKLFVIGFDEDETENDVMVKHKVVDSKLLTTDDDGDETYKTLEQIEDEAGMGDWGDLDELKDHMRMRLYNYVHSRCGFGIWIE